MCVCFVFVNEVHFGDNKSLPCELQNKNTVAQQTVPAQSGVTLAIIQQNDHTTQQPLLPGGVKAVVVVVTARNPSSSRAHRHDFD